MRARSAVILWVTVLGLAACEDGLNLGGAKKPAGEAAAASTTREVREGVRDVERPDVFKTTEDALWDGRPSLGGIWAAHPDVTEPERAILINETTGQRIAGALFRRERDNPGPKLQLSSDAAAALNILAGQPTRVTVVAVRREEIVVEEAPPVISDEKVGDDAAEAAQADDEGDVAAAAAGAAATETRPRRGNFFSRLFGGNRRTKQPAEDDAATAESAAAPQVETKPLDPVASTAAAAIARAEADEKPAARPERPARNKAGVKNPYIQVGQFSVEANAIAAADRLRRAGIVPNVVQGSNDDQLFWRVVVGPVNSADDQAALLAQVKKLGFGDAFLTSS